MSIRDQIRSAPTKEEKLTIYRNAMESNEFRFASRNTVGKWARALKE